ncbi:MAG: hypothetical protein PVSMB7_29000 [Chloroflexota bacterium]
MRIALQTVNHDTSAPRAAVLEPFGTELGLGLNSGQPEIDALHSAGFTVDTYRETAVTIPVIESLSRYSVVYMESHSGTCGAPLCAGNDVFVLTGVEVTGSVDQYASLFADGSVTEGIPDTEPGHIYLAFTSRLVALHMSKFPDSSIVFLNGCDLLAEPAFLQALTSLNAASIFTWNKKVYNFDAEPTADLIFARLAGGLSVSAALADARGAGLGTSTAEEGTALALIGDGNNTFARALTSAPPIPTATPVSTTAAPASPTPTVTAVKKNAACRYGYSSVSGRCVRVVRSPQCHRVRGRAKGVCAKGRP